MGPAWLVLLAGWSAAGAPCPPLDQLASQADRGVLDEPTVACLDASATGRGPLADRLTASRLRIAHAFASGAREPWAGAVRYHLDQLDADDADLSLALGAWLLDAGQPAEALTRAEHALAHRYAWDGDDKRGDKLYTAHAVRARAAAATIDALPEHANPMERRAAESRLLLYAVEWLSVDLATDRDPTEALAGCTRAGWTADRCRERARAIGASGGQAP